MHADSLLADIGLAILAAAIFGIPAFFLRIPLMLAYIAAGISLGPALGSGLIKSSESISTLSEIGLVFLMFILGLEIDIKKLLQAGKAVAINGVTQFVGCAILAVGYFMSLGYQMAPGSHELVYLAVAASLSSTLIVVKVLSDRMELDTLSSRITLGILVIQDLWAIAFLAIQPNLSDLKASLLFLSLGRGVILVTTSFLFARYVLPKLFQRVAKNTELMLLVAIGWCVAVCGLAKVLHLSLEMGGLIAGVAIASFPYHVEVATKVSSLRDFFITLFFVALGLQIPYPSAPVLTLAMAIIGFVLVSRLITMFPVLYLLRYGNRGSLIPAINLSQVSEFSLVLVSLGVSYGHLHEDVLSAFVIALILTALLSSFVIPKTHDAYQLLNPLLEKLGLKDRVTQDDRGSQNDGGNVRSLKTQPKIVILGFFREGSSLLHKLIARHTRSILNQILVVDLNPEAHHELVGLGVNCKYGDISHLDTLKHLHLDKSKVIICTLSDHQLKGTTNLKLLGILKSLSPNAKAIVTAETLESARHMYENGASYVLLPRIVAAGHLADVLERMEIGADENLRKESTEFLENWKEVIP